MDSMAVMALILTGANGLLQTGMQLSQGQITADQAHANFLAAHANLAQAIAAFQATLVAKK